MIDDALEMRGVGNLVDDATIDIDGDKDESIDTTISNLAETLRTFQKSVHSITNPSVSICKARMQALTHQLRFVLSPPMIYLPQKGVYEICNKT